ncbi:hypothetical protein OG738_20575 [Amycolatopsis sp. NBC_01488]|uniref:hypothetical protein n=1 Tax=Amycolatopsis sp. NBC_01488 TaxID=2903563 RepID=UPI002E29FDF3|nr:hypothetical protein [Amycolatopsis sp. NBC_01488]
MTAVADAAEERRARTPQLRRHPAEVEAGSGDEQRGGVPDDVVGRDDHRTTLALESAAQQVGDGYLEVRVTAWVSVASCA